MNDYLLGLWYLLRLKPLAAWAGCGMLLGLAVAVYEVGIAGVDWTLGIAGGLVFMILQYVAHPLNDMTDYEVDKLAYLELTDRKKVLVSGLMTFKQLGIISGVLLMVALTLSSYIVISRPYAMCFFAVGFFAVIGYNFFKLSYQPFSEWTVVFPVLVSLIAGVAYTASGQLSMLAIYVGVIHALVNIPFFLTSRAMDVDADRAVGKNTTLVKYPNVDWQAVITVISWIVAGSVFFNYGMPYNIISAIFAIGVFFNFGATFKFNMVIEPGEYSICRKKQIYTSIGHSIVLAGTILALGGLV